MGARLKLYDFELIQNGAVVEAWRGVPLPTPSAAWPRLEALAAAVDGNGFKIRVRDAAGGIVIQTGVASMRRLAEAC